LFKKKKRFKPETSVTETKTALGTKKKRSKNKKATRLAPLLGSRLRKACGTGFYSISGSGF
jgi:hypothetical protein